MNKKVIIIASLLLLLVTTISAQTSYPNNYSGYRKGYVFMKNGDILKGKYIYSSDMKKLEVISGNQVRIYASEDVERITKKSPLEMADTFHVFNQADFKPSRIFNFTEFGLLVGNQDNTIKSPVIFHSSVNYSFTPLLSAGLGTGVEMYREAYLPVTGNVMYKLNNHRTSPYVSLQAGYQIPVEGTRMTYYEVMPVSVNPGYLDYYYPYPYYQNSALNARGGVLLNPSMGFFHQLSRGLGMGVSVGYRFQILNYTGDNDYRLEVNYNRLSVKLGFIFN